MAKLSSGLILIYPLFAALLSTAPLMRGLFFQVDLLPYSIGFGIVLLMVALRAVIRRDRMFRGPMPALFFWLAASYGLSFFVAASKVEALKGFLRYLMYFAVFCSAAYITRGRKGRRALTLAVFFSATAVALIGVSAVTGYVAFPGAAQSGRIMSTLQYPNALASYLMFSSLIGLTLTSTEDSPTLRTAFSLGTFCQTLVFLASYSRGGWVVYPLAIALIYVGMPKTQRSRLSFHLCTTLTGVLMVARRFCETVEGKTPKAGLVYFLFGLGIVVCFEIGYTFFRRVSQDMLSPAVRKVLGWIASLYVAVTVTAYLVALTGQYSSGVTGIVSASMLRRFAAISVDDPSLLTRAFASRDAFRIFRDHALLGGGAGAWNAWYHQYQTVLYWTTEVHNHYAQVLVETGILGFAAYAGIWGALVFYGVRFILWARQADKMDDSRGVARTWGLFAACVAVGIHSGMDFELSLPGIAVQLWTVLAIVYQSALDPDAFLNRRRWKDTQLGEGAPEKRVTGIAVALLSLALIVPSAFLIRGAQLGSLGAAALLRQDFYTASKAYQQARKYDPLSASYSMDLGQAYAAMGLLEGRAELKERAVASLETARKLEPFNLVHRQKEAEILVSLGEIGRAVEVAREVHKGVPLDMAACESFARLSVVNHIALAEAAGKDKQELPARATTLLTDVIAIPDNLAKMKWTPEALEPTSSLITYIGQAYYLKGDLDTALTFFDKAIARGPLPEAESWRTAARILQGQTSLADSSDEVREIVSYFHPAVR